MRELLEERAGASQVIHCLKAVGPHWQSGGEPPYRGRGGKSGGSYAELFIIKEDFSLLILSDITWCVGRSKRYTFTKKYTYRGKRKTDKQTHLIFYFSD